MNEEEIKKESKLGLRSKNIVQGKQKKTLEVYTE